MYTKACDYEGYVNQIKQKVNKKKIKINPLLKWYLPLSECVQHPDSKRHKEVSLSLTENVINSLLIFSTFIRSEVFISIL